MQIRPELTDRLRAMLLQADALRADRDVDAKKVDDGNAALRRVRQTISDLNSKLPALSNVSIPVQRDRISLLIAGQEVDQPDPDEVENRAVQARHLTAQRDQAVEDFKAIEQHVAELTKALAALDANIASKDAAFYRGLADAALEAYRRNAIAFIAENVPLLWSVVERVRTLTGEVPEWSPRVLSYGSLVVRWREDEETQETQWSEKVHKMVEVWPRNGHLLSGELAVSDHVIDDIVRRMRSAGVRAPGPPWHAPCRTLIPDAAHRETVTCWQP